MNDSEQVLEKLLKYIVLFQSYDNKSTARI